PAFDAGIHALLDHRKRQGSLASVVDGADEAILLFDFGGNLVHQNPAAVKILSALDANSRILEAVKSKARCLVAELHTRGNDKKHCYLPASSVVNVVHGMFEIKGSYLCGESISDVISVMVTVRQKPGRLPERNETQDQSKLTQRESNVALLLAKRLSNAEIAELLNISEHTARHHTERVLRKLRVASRKHVGDRLRENRIDRGASAE
ncbi:MAG: LuxR C-terminal-related transcriptional regulator, partial [Gemmatimonadota bacterium]|nr:LuxR C-terminal-related transcriptional regulator [Gemmatimonadota bacterium]